MILNDYLNLITAQHRSKPNYLATVTAKVNPYVYIQGLLSSLITMFDVDVAIGVQLDVIGALIGISRIIKEPIPNSTFTWAGPTSTGWGYGVWQDTFNPQASVTLPDDVYRTLIKTKIAANSWDGTTEGAYTIWGQVFSNQNILIQDNQNMTMAIVLVGGQVDTLTIGLLTGGYIPLRPQGVAVSYYAVPTDTKPAFAWGTQSTYLGGWGVGSWSQIVVPT